MFDDLLRRLRLDVTGLANTLLVVVNSAIAYGRTVDVVMPSGASTVTAKHGLGRLARGATIVAGGDGTSVYSVAIPTSASSVTVNADTAAAADTAIRLWVF